MGEKEQRDIFKNNLLRLINQTTLTQVEIAKKINVSPQTFNTWVKGIAIPRMGKVQALADFFGVNKSDLIEDKSEALGNKEIKEASIQNIAEELFMARMQDKGKVEICYINEINYKVDAYMIDLNELMIGVFVDNNLIYKISYADLDSRMDKVLTYFEGLMESYKSEENHLLGDD